MMLRLTEAKSLLLGSSVVMEPSSGLSTIKKTFAQHLAETRNCSEQSTTSNSVHPLENPMELSYYSSTWGNHPQYRLVLTKAG